MNRTCFEYAALYLLGDWLKNDPVTQALQLLDILARGLLTIAPIETRASSSWYETCFLSR